MAEITPKMVKELRDKTGSGMGDCKKALVENDGDFQEAIEYLRKKGAASLTKRQDRSANEGLIVAKTSTNGNNAAIVEINCETDFVARNEEFVNYSQQVCDSLLINEAQSIDDLMNLKVGTDTIGGLYNGILAKFSEKIETRRFQKIVSDGFIAEYTHAGNKLAVLIEISESNPTEKAISMIRDIAMQIAAMNPSFIDKDSVPKDVIDKEKEIYAEAAITEGKKPEIAARIAEGRLNKFFQENCLIEQQFVKDSSKTVNDVIKEISNEFGKDIKIRQFIRYFLGESLD